MTAAERQRAIIDFAMDHAPEKPMEIEPLPAQWEGGRIDVRWRHLGHEHAIRLVFRNDRATIESSYCDRTLTEALAFVSLYRKVVEFAAALEVYARTLPEPEEDPS